MTSIPASRIDGSEAREVVMPAGPDHTITFAGERGVLGTRDFVPLKDREIFCSEECLSNWFSDLPAMSSRLP